MQPAPSASSRSRWHRILMVLAVIVAALLVLGVLRAGLAANSPDFHATTYEPPAPATDFNLTDHRGRETSLAMLRGGPVLLFFGYTNCPDVCPLTLSLLREALQSAGAEAGDARVLLITVDPTRDSPEVLARYVGRFGPDFIGLTGTETELRSLMQAYGVHAEADHGDPSLLGHTSAVFGIDDAGMIRVLLRPDAPREEFLADVETLLDL